MMGMEGCYGAGGMLAALVLGAMGWPGTAAAQFALPQTFNNNSSNNNSSARQLLPGNGVPVAPTGAVTVPPSAGPATGALRPPPMPGPGGAPSQVFPT